jgi:hypothetical protein
LIYLADRATSSSRSRTATATFQGTVADVPKFSHRSGFLDAVARFSVNLIGGPAMQPAEFVKWRQTILLGASLTMWALDTV